VGQSPGASGLGGVIVRMLVLLDVACFVLHTMLIAFNMVGWMWRRTRAVHRLTLGATIFSWFVLGIWYGWGYCVCADWHFQIRRELGYVDVDTSYLQLLARQVAGLAISRTLADVTAMIVLALILVATAAAWLGEIRARSATDA
jgi:hypothetical protein